MDIGGTQEERQDQTSTMVSDLPPLLVTLVVHFFMTGDS